ncbi:MAG: MFS transporter [bacterium]|nr:MFS transporter [bacterium]
MFQPDANLPTFRRKSVWGWAFYDVANSAFATTILAVIFNKYYALQVANGDEGIFFSLFGIQSQIPGTTIFSYLISISTLFVMAISPFIGAMADESGHRKRYLFYSTILGVLGTFLLGFVDRGEWLFGGIAFIIANVGFNAGLLFYDALLKQVAKPNEIGKVSGFGWGVGYLGGGLLLLINLFMLSPPAWAFWEPRPVTDTFFSVAVWWVLFSIPMMFWVYEKKEPLKINVFRLWKHSFNRLYKTFLYTKQLKHTFLFLIAYFFYNNGIQTVILMASIFGESVLQMNSSQLILFFLMIQGCGFIGSVFFGWLTQWLNDKTALFLSLIVWMLVCIWTYGIGTFFDPILEFHIIGILAGLVLGSSQSLSRSLFARFTPINRTAEFFGFFSVQSRISTLIGPLLYGTMLWLTHSIQLAILCLLFFFVCGGLLLLLVNPEAGEKEALSYERL